MDALLIPALLILGFLAGSLFSSYLMRWCALVFTSSAKHGGDFLGPPRRRIVWALPFVTLLHPAPYIFCLVALVAFRQFHGASASAWLWFFGAFGVSVLFNGLRTASMILKLRRNRTVTS